MKKIFRYIFLSIMVIGLSACGKNEKPDAIAKNLTSYLESDFEYYKTTNYVDENGECRQIVVKGTYVANPYQETIQVIEGQENSPWEKAVYTGAGEVVTAKVYAESEWTETLLKREYPYGYEENLTLEFAGEEHIDDVLCEVYKGSYTVTLGDNLFVDEKIDAMVSQKYYVEKEKGALIGVDTDLTDLNEKTYIYNAILANGYTLKEAKESAEKVDDFSKTEELRLSYN